MASGRDPIELAARALRHRDRSRHEIDERLIGAGVGEEQRADALDTLERIGYLNDSRYAGSRAATLAARDYGDDAIRLDLARAGVAPETAAAALAALEPERERAIALALRLGHDTKTAARLARRGFGEEAVEAALAGHVAEGDP